MHFSHLPVIRKSPRFCIGTYHIATVICNTKGDSVSVWRCVFCPCFLWSHVVWCLGSDVFEILGVHVFRGTGYFLSSGIQRQRWQIFDLEGWNMNVLRRVSSGRYHNVEVWWGFCVVTYNVWMLLLISALVRSKNFVFPKGCYTLSVKLSDFNCHSWRKNWVNCAVLTGNNTGLRTVLSSSLSHREPRISLRESYKYLVQFFVQLILHS